MLILKSLSAFELDSNSSIITLFIDEEDRITPFLYKETICFPIYPPAIFDNMTLFSCICLLFQLFLPFLLN